MKTIIKSVGIPGLLLLAFALTAQRSFTLDSCLIMAEANYPLIQQRDLLGQSSAFTIENAGKGKLPRIQIVGQATYQSDVTGLPSGGMISTPQISKDQYRLYGEVVQPLTDLKIINQQKRLTELNADLDNSHLEIKLFAIRQRVSDLFFGSLLLEGQISQVQITQQELDRGLHQLKIGLQEGVVYASQMDQLKAEVLGLEQRLIQLQVAKDGFDQMLRLFLGISVKDKFQLILPPASTVLPTINRPELGLFQKQQELMTLQRQMIDQQNVPHVSLFFQGGLGRPALNMLNNDFDLYYITGLRLSYSLSNFYTSNKQKQVFEIKQQIVSTEQETFLFNLDLLLASKYLEIAAMQEIIDRDHEIIQLREGVIQTAQAQLADGVITATDYKNMVADADLARQSLNIHQIERIKKQQEYKITTGN